MAAVVLTVLFVSTAESKCEGEQRIKYIATILFNRTKIMDPVSFFFVHTEDGEQCNTTSIFLKNVEQHFTEIYCWV